MNPASTSERNTLARWPVTNRVCVCVFTHPALFRLYFSLFMCSGNEMCFLRYLLPLEQG